MSANQNLKLTGEKLRMRALKLAGMALYRCVFDHILALAGSRRNKFGASSSGHFSVDKVRALAPEGNKIGVGIAIPGISRARHDLTILPKPPRKYLTIPLNAMAYGMTAREFNQRNPGKTFVAGRAIMFQQEKNAAPQPLYALVRTAHQPRDPRLLPSPEKFVQTVRKGLAMAPGGKVQ